MYNTFEIKKLYEKIIIERVIKMNMNLDQITLIRMHIFSVFRICIFNGKNVHPNIVYKNGDIQKLQNYLVK